MKNTIGSAQEEVSAMLHPIVLDTPDLSRDEILGILKKEGSATVARPRSMRNMFAITTLGCILCLIGLALHNSKTGSTAETSHRLVANQSAPLAISKRSSDAVAQAPELASSVEILQGHSTQAQEASVETGDGRMSEVIARDIIQEPRKIDPALFPSLGLYQTDSGEIIYYHLSNKIGFPIRAFIREYDNSREDPLSEILGNRPYHPEYVTDGRGVMMMRYEVEPVGSGNKILLNVFDRDLGVDKLEEPIQTIEQRLLVVDTIQNVCKVSVIADYGIAHIDTMLSGPASDLIEMDHRIIAVREEAKRSDSALRASLGDNQQKGRINHTNTKHQRSVPVEHARSEDKETQAETVSADELSAQYTAAKQQMIAEPTVEGKIRLEAEMRRLMRLMLDQEFQAEAKELQNASELIPIQIRAASGEEGNHLLDNGLIFWYRPSDSLQLVLGSRTTESVSDSLSGLGLTVFPNPASQQVHVQYHVDQPTSLRLSLLDVTGRVLRSESWQSSAGGGSRSMDISSCLPGIYVLLLDSPRGRVARQVVLRP